MTATEFVLCAVILAIAYAWSLERRAQNLERSKQRIREIEKEEERSRSSR